MPAEVGEKAQVLTLPAGGWENEVSLGDYTNDRAVALFYCGDSSSVGAHRIGDWAQIGRLEEKGASVLTASADAPRSDRALASDQGIGSPRLTDYGLGQEDGYPERACFIIGAGCVESLTRSQPGFEAVLEHPNKVL